MKKGLAGPWKWRPSCVWPWLWTRVKPQGAVHFRCISLLLVHYVFKTKYIEIPVILSLWCVVLSKLYKTLPSYLIVTNQSRFSTAFNFYEAQVHLGHYGRFLNKNFQKRMTINKKIEWNQPCCYCPPGSIYLAEHLLLFLVWKVGIIGCGYCCVPYLWKKSNFFFNAQSHF